MKINLPQTSQNNDVNSKLGSKSTENIQSVIKDDDKPTIVVALSRSVFVEWTVMMRRRAHSGYTA